MKRRSNPPFFLFPRARFLLRPIFSLVHGVKIPLDRHDAALGRVPATDDIRICGGTDCLRDSSISTRNERFAKEAGLPRIRIHDFRHSHVSLLANAGINIQEIARRLGHAKIEMTWNTYSHMYPKESERALSVLNKIEI